MAGPPIDPEDRAKSKSQAFNWRAWTPTRLAEAIDWIEAQLPKASPEARARFAEQFNEKDAERKIEAVRGKLKAAIPQPVKSAVKGAGSYARSLFETPEAVKPGFEALRGEHTARTSSDVPVINALLAPHRFAGNLAIDELESTTSPGGGALVASDLIDLLPAKAAGVAAGAALPGLFSRVDRLVEKEIGKKGVAPQRLANLLKAGASSEEVQYRKLDQLIKESGNKPISKEALQAHLAANPAPRVEQTMYGPPPRPPANVDYPVTSGEYHPSGRRYHTIHLPRGGEVRVYQTANAWRTSGTAAREFATEAEALAAGQQHAREAIQHRLGQETRYSQYTLGGGEDYRETLLTLNQEDPRLVGIRERLDKIDEQLANPWWHGRDLSAVTPEEVTAESARELALRDERNAVYEQIRQLRGNEPTAYQSSHWDPENILGHTRTKERTLPTGGRGRFLEEVQSDWHQAGKQRGYTSPTAQADLQRASAALEEARANRHRFLDEFEQTFQGPEFVPPSFEEWKARELNEYYSGPQHDARNRQLYERDLERIANNQRSRARTQALQADPRLADLNARLRAADEAHAVARNALHSGVPDAPFKESWPDLVLKQQLLDVSRNHPDLSWLGFTSGRTQNERYNLAQYVSRLEYDTRNGRLFGYGKTDPQEIVFQESVDPEDLERYIGVGPAQQMRNRIEAAQQAREADRAGWRVQPVGEGNSVDVINPQGQVVQNYYHGSTYPDIRPPTPEEVSDYIDRAIRDETTGVWADPKLEGLDLAIGGEGMQSFYDKTLPSRLNKILGPLGGKVEQGIVPTEKLQDVPLQRWRVVGGGTPEYGSNYAYAHTYATEEDAREALRQLGPHRGYDRIEPYQTTEQQMVTANEPAWIANLTPEMKQRIRDEGLPLMSLLPFLGAAGAAASQQQQGEGDQSNPFAGLASVAPIALGGRRPVGSLDRTLKYLGKSRYGLRAPIVERLADLYEGGRALTPKATWGGTTHPELLAAFGGDPDLAQQRARFFGTTSAGTSVPKNTQESVAALTHALDRPGVPFEATGQRPDVTGRLRPYLSLYDTVITNAESKLPSLNRALEGLDPSGPKTEAMSQFMWGQPRSPIDRHVLWALGSADDTLSAQQAQLKAYMLGAEGLAPHQLNERKVYSRYEGALARALQGLDPERPYNPLFGDFWEGARARKGEPYQGGPIDILRSRDLLGPGYLTDPDRLKAALANTSGLWVAPKPEPRSFLDLGR